MVSRYERDWNKALSGGGGLTGELSEALRFRAVELARAKYGKLTLRAAILAGMALIALATGGYFPVALVGAKIAYMSLATVISLMVGIGVGKIVKGNSRMKIIRHKLSSFYGYDENGDPSHDQKHQRPPANDNDRLRDALEQQAA